MTPQPAWKQRYAPHIGLMAPDAPLFLHSAGSSDPVDQIRYLAELGFAGIEDNFLRIRPPDLQVRIGAELARHGMAMGCFVNNPMHWNRPLWGLDTDDARARLMHDLRESIEAAQRTGGKYLTVVSAMDPATPVAFQRVRMVENLKRLAPMAEKASVILALETVDSSRWPGMLLHHIPDAYAVAKAVDSSSVQLVFDFGHIAPMDGNVIQNLKAVWDKVAVIQVADIPGRLELGSGELNWVNIFRTIRELGYTGLIELEHLISRPGAAGERMLLDNLRIIDDAL
ncbi:MAG: sugar phosphate isomerase/epimerase [Rhodospirillales bacterium]|nr:sugar phosphate isomerase/epimerase [Rhodospirillales bacterium]